MVRNASSTQAGECDVQRLEYNFQEFLEVHGVVVHSNKRDAVVYFGATRSVRRLRQREQLLKNGRLCSKHRPKNPKEHIIAVAVHSGQNNIPVSKIQRRVVSSTDVG